MASASASARCVWSGAPRCGSTSCRSRRLPRSTASPPAQGCNLALGCDLVIASDRARFSEIFSKRGLSVDFGGSWLLPRLIGMHRAKELVFLADLIDAAEADRIGLVNRVVPHDELDATVREIAGRLAALPPVQLSVSKRLLNQSLSVSMS